MGIGNKAKNVAEQAKGKAKYQDDARRMAGDEFDTSQQTEGRDKQGKAKLRQGAEKAKNTFDR